MTTVSDCNASQAVLIVVTMSATALISVATTFFLMRQYYASSMSSITRECDKQKQRAKHAEGETQHLKRLITDQLRRESLDAVKMTKKLVAEKQAVNKMKKKLDDADKAVKKFIAEGGSLMENWGLSFKDVQLEESIGEGAFGTVYRGNFRRQGPTAAKGNRRISSERVIPAAIKTLRRERVCDGAVGKFMHEAKIMCALRHNNIVSLLGVVYEDGPEKLCLVLEYCSNGSLHAMLRSSRSENTGAWETTYRSLAEGISECFIYLHHEQPTSAIIHRDLKPANVLVSDDMTPKVADFGEATRFSEHEARKRAQSIALSMPHGDLEHSDSDDEENAGQVLTMTMVGTPMYCAPEILMLKPYGPSVDCYSFSIVLLAMACGQFEPVRKQFRGFTGVSIVKGWRPSVPDGLARNRPRLVALIREMWSGVPCERPTFIDIRARLDDDDQLLEEEGASNDCNAGVLQGAPSESVPKFVAKGMSVPELERQVHKRDLKVAALRAENAMLRIDLEERRKTELALKSITAPANTEDQFGPSKSSNIITAKSEKLDAAEGKTGRFKRRRSLQAPAPAKFRSFMSRGKKSTLVLPSPPRVNLGGGSPIFRHVIRRADE